jgi:hypothetical protein
VLVGAVTRDNAELWWKWREKRLRAFAGCHR